MMRSLYTISTLMKSMFILRGRSVQRLLYTENPYAASEVTNLPNLASPSSSSPIGAA